MVLKGLEWREKIWRDFGRGEECGGEESREEETSAENHTNSQASVVTPLGPQEAFKFILEWTCLNKILMRSCNDLSRELNL